jgi:hypothetical protein
MPSRNRHYFSARSARVIAAVVILLAATADSRVYAAEVTPEPKFAELAVGLPRASLTLVSRSPVIANGRTVGAIAIYDDPMTQRPADYLEVSNSDGAVVVVSWFDPFGIERLVVDRALIEGGPDPQGVFVALVNGEVI